MPTLSELLRAHAPAPLARHLDAVADLDACLDALVSKGREALPEISVAADDWARFLARHLQDDGIEEQLAEMHAADVHLVLGCLAGAATAYRRLDEQLRRVSRQALASIRLGTISSDEVLQAARVKLLTGADREPKLASYAGRGALGGWLRVILARTALSMIRAREPLAASPREEDALFELADPDDPRLASIRARCAPALRSAVEQAARELPAGDRMLLRMHLVDGLTIDDLAAVYGTHRATAARRLARTRHALVQRARSIAIETLGLDGEDELASLSGLLLSKFDVTIRRILGATDTGVPE